MLLLTIAGKWVGRPRPGYEKRPILWLKLKRVALSISSAIQIAASNLDFWLLFATVRGDVIGAGLDTLYSKMMMCS